MYVCVPMCMPSAEEALTGVRSFGARVISMYVSCHVGTKI